MGINLTSSELRSKMVDWIRIEYEKGQASAHSDFLHYTLVSSTGEVVMEDDGVLYNGETISYDEYLEKLSENEYFDEFEIQLVVNHLHELIGRHLSLCIITLDRSGMALEKRWVDPMIGGTPDRQLNHLYFSLHNPTSSRACHYNIITSVPNPQQQEAIPYYIQVNEAILPTATSEVDGDDEALLPTVDGNVDSTLEVDGDNDDIPMYDGVDPPLPHGFGNLVHTLEGNSDMDICSKQMLQYFGAMIERCRLRCVPVDDIKWFWPCVPRDVENKKFLMKFLHYCPTTGKFMNMFWDTTT
jgi:hypothetical protein